MTSSYIDSLTDLLLNHSCRAEKGDLVIIESIDLPKPIVRQVVDRVFSFGAVPVVIEKSHLVMKAFAVHGSTSAYEQLAENELFMMRKAKHFIGFRVPDEKGDFSEVPIEKMKILLDNYI